MQQSSFAPMASAPDRASSASVFAPQFGAAFSQNNSSAAIQQPEPATQFLFDDRINLSSAQETGGRYGFRQQAPANATVSADFDIGSGQTALNLNQGEPRQVFAPQQNDQADFDDQVNLDGVGERNYGDRDDFKLVDKFSTFNHLVPGAPVPFQQT